MTARTDISNTVRIVASVGLLFSATHFGRCSEAARGRATVVGPATVDFGKYKSIEKKVARYRIKNSGNGLLKILKVRKTCGCASATASKTELEPGEESTIEVVILSNTIFGPFSKNTYVETNDAKNRFLRLTVAGNAVPLVEILPKANVYAGRLRTDQAWSQTFVLKPTEDGVKLGIPRVESTFSVSADMSQPAASSSEHHLKLSLAPVEKGGDLRCSVSVPVLAPTNHPPIRLGVSAKIGAELAAIPGLARLSLLDEPQLRTFRFHVLGQRSRVLKPEELALPKVDGLSFEVRLDANGRWLLAKATFSPDFVKQLYADESIPLTFSVPGAASTDVTCRIKK